MSPGMKRSAILLLVAACSSGGGKNQVVGGALGTTHESTGLDRVADYGPRSMGLDVGDLPRRHTSLFVSLS